MTSGGGSSSFDVVVIGASQAGLAVGYHLAQRGVPSIKGKDGSIIHRRGVTDEPGLYFIGLPWQHARGSALIGFVKDDAAFIAGRIDSHLGDPAGLVGTDAGRT